MICIAMKNSRVCTRLLHKSSILAAIVHHIYTGNSHTSDFHDMASNNDEKTSNNDEKTWCRSCT